MVNLERLNKREPFQATKYQPCSCIRTGKPPEPYTVESRSTFVTKCLYRSVWQTQNLQSYKCCLFLKCFTVWYLCAQCAILWETASQRVVTSWSLRFLTPLNHLASYYSLLHLKFHRNTRAQNICSTHLRRSQAAAPNMGWIRI